MSLRQSSPSHPVARRWMLAPLVLALSSVAILRLQPARQVRVAGLHARCVLAHEAGIAALAFSPDGVRLAVGVTSTAGTRKVTIWDHTLGKELRSLAGHRFRVLKLGFTPRGDQLITADYAVVYRWDPVQGVLRGIMPGRPGFPLAAALSPDGNQLAILDLTPADKEGRVTLWDVMTGARRELPKELQLSGTLVGIAFAPDGHTLACAHPDGRISLWDVRAWRAYAVLQGSMGDGHTLAFSPGGKYLAAGHGVAPVAHVWDLETRTLCGELRGHFAPIYCIAFSPDGTLLASGSDDTTVRLWDPGTGRERGLLAEHTERVNALAFSPDGRVLASGSLDGTARLWDIPVQGTRLIPYCYPNKE